MNFINYPKKSLGQNFLIDKNIINKIVQIGNIDKKNTILEIGPGYGNLTKKIISINPRKVVAVEKDKKLFGIDKLNVQRSEIPAVTHVDYSARVQTVNEKTNPIYYILIKKFKEKTSCPVILNTSFNVRGEPIVNTPKDAFDCFMGTELDTLVIGNCYLIKKEQNQSLKKDYTKQFDLD